MIAGTKLKEIIAKHEEWLRGGRCGEPADLRGADLRVADLRGANLRRANLRGAGLCRVNLCFADLRSADLRGADLRGADLRGADLCHANLCSADLCGANLCDANLCNATLCGAKNVPFIPMTCPDSGSFTAWKKAHDHIVKLLIPEDARRSSATGRKCRCDKAVVIAIETMSGEPTDLCMVRSDYYLDFVYKVGETVTVPDFCEDRFRECAPGIHFFINRQEAVDYN